MAKKIKKPVKSSSKADKSKSKAIMPKMMSAKKMMK